MKKILALLCVAVICVACCLPVFAAAGTGTITIKNTVPGQDYSVYQIATLESFSGSSFSYVVLPAWENFFKAGEAGSAYFEINSDGYLVKTVDPTDAQMVQLAKDALAYVQKVNADLDPANDIAVSAPKVEATGDSVTFAGLEYGYYLVDSNLGTICSLNTHNETYEFEEKNAKPSIGKVADTNSTGIGSTVTYTITVTVQKGAVNYVVHDKMSAGLTYKGISSVKIGTEDVDAAKYTVSTDVDHNGDAVIDCTFEVAFDNDFIGSLAAGTEIKIVYTAVVNESAVVADGDPNPDNPNEAKLEYGDDGDTTFTPEVIADVKIYQFDLVKVDGADNKLLDGAEFELYDTKGTAETTDDVLVEVVAVTGGYRVADEDETGVTTMAVSGGLISVSGLGLGDYYLKETKAPDGYNLLTGTKDVKIDGTDLSATITDGKWTDGGVKVINNTGAVLPSTGGFGTTMFILIGGGLMLCTGILLVTKKRMEKIAD